MTTNNISALLRNVASNETFLHEFTISDQDTFKQQWSNTRIETELRYNTAVSYISTIRSGTKMAESNIWTGSARKFGITIVANSVIASQSATYYDDFLPNDPDGAPLFDPANSVLKFTVIVAPVPPSP